MCPPWSIRRHCLQRQNGQAMYLHVRNTSIRAHAYIPVRQLLHRHTDIYMLESSPDHPPHAQQIHKQCRLELACRPRHHTRMPADIRLGTEGLTDNICTKNHFSHTRQSARYVCTCVSMHACMNVYMYVWVYVRMHACMHACTHTHTNAH